MFCANLELDDVHNYNFQFQIQQFQSQNMIQKPKKAIDHSLPTSPPSSNSPNLGQLVFRDPLLLEYFQKHSSLSSPWKLAHELMLDGLRYRTNPQATPRQCCCAQTQVLPSPLQQQYTPRVKTPTPNKNEIKEKYQEEIIRQVPSKEKEKHYNVSFIKHNRFLSPNQRKQIVTPKVTETIPMKGTSPLIIYGKPRIKIDEQCGCPYHNNEEECHRSANIKETPSKIQHQVHVRQSQIPNQIDTNYHQISKFNSTPNLGKFAEQNHYDLNLSKTKKNGNNAKNHQESKFPTEVEGNPGQIVYVDKIVQVQSRAPGKMRIVRLSQADKRAHGQSSYPVDRNQYQKYLMPNKKEVQSKIKFLIERDKKTKQLENNLKKQEKRMKDLQKLVKKDKKVEAPPPKKTIKITSKDILSLSSDSSQMSMMDSRVMQNYRDKVKNGGSAAHFGIAQDEDCDDCSKTFSESSQNEEFSGFNK